MAVVTLLGAATFSTASGSKSVTATPAVGDLIVIITAHSGNTSTSATPPTDDQSGTYTLITSSLKNTSADVMCAWVRTAKIGSAVSTIFTHNPGTSTGGGLAVMKITGMSKVDSAAVKQSGVQQNQAASGTPTVTLGAAMLTGNCGIGAVFNASNPAGMTSKATPWAEDTDVGYNSPVTGLEVMSADSGETASSIAWGGTSATAFCALVVELDTTATTHSCTGAMTAGTGALAGTASSATTRSSTGALAGGGATLAGTASSATTRPSTGALTGPGAALVGTAARTGVTAALTGTITASVTEADIVAGGKTIILTLTGDTWIT